MKNFEPNKTEIQNKMIQYFFEFAKSLDLTEDQKIQLRNNVNEGRVSHPEYKAYIDWDLLMEECIEIAYDKWKNEKLEEISFWKTIVIANAEINNTPQNVADNAVKRLRSEFIDIQNKGVVTSISVRTIVKRNWIQKFFRTCKEKPIIGLCLNDINITNSEIECIKDYGNGKYDIWIRNDLSINKKNSLNISVNSIKR